jgi:hypothetical protein
MKIGDILIRISGMNHQSNIFAATRAQNGYYRAQDDRRMTRIVGAPENS